MNFLGKLGKNKKTEKESINVNGWDYITKACEKVYPTQKDPKHYGTLINWKFGGNDRPMAMLNVPFTNKRGTLTGKDCGSIVWLSNVFCQSTTLFESIISPITQSIENGLI